MISKIVIVVIVAVVCQNSAPSSAQFFGGVATLPGWERMQQAGYRSGPLWGSLSQSFNRQGMSSLITYSGGASAISQQGTGLSGSLAVQPGIGGQASVRGQAGLFNSQNSHVNAFAQHDRFLNRDLRPVGPETNSAGVNYLNQNGASAFAQGSQTNGQPAIGTVGGSVPIYTNGNAQISATGQTTFGHGMKPDSQVGISASLNI